MIVAGPTRIIGTLYAQDASTTVAGLVKLGGGTTNFLRADGTWAAPPNTTYTAATAAPADISASAGAVGTSTNYARQDHTHKITLATGDANGQVKIAGTNVSVKGLGSNAYTSTEFIPTSQKGAASGVVPLNSSSKIDTTYLPSYVDDVIEAANSSSFPATGETGKIYVALDNNKTYRWGGSSYVEISPSLALGTTASTASKGNHTHTVTATGNVSTTTATTANKTADVTTASGTATYTPAGSVSTPTISVKTAGTTTTVPNVTNAGTVPTLETTNKTVVTGTSVANEVLSFTTDNATMVNNWNAGATPTLGTAITVKTGDAAYQSSQPTFTGTGVRLVTGNIPVPATYTSTFTGTSATTSVPST